MSMSSCEKCWDTLCTCGYQYLTWNVKELMVKMDIDVEYSFRKP
jgi:hypothetical protein